MRILRLEICGFKSFTDRVLFTFGNGVTGIVGPNGCGKSNVVDAIRWAMGEQSAKHLRGRSMEDVIFAGSEAKAPMGMAEVTLTFSNDSPALLPEQYRGFPEIAVTRRLFRSGDSEYAINRTPCRLLDITELFLGTGVGTKAYSIIEQGRIGLIVSAKPEDRRSLIEEAAGITRYKSRRKAAERKMELTEQNLVRVGDITNELGRRLDSLDRQARKAEKYKRLKAEMKGIELHTASMRYLELTVCSQSARVRAEELQAEERAVLDQTETCEAQLEQVRAALADEERALALLNEELHAKENELTAGQTNLEAWRRESAEAAKRVDEAERELAEIAAARLVLEGELTGLAEQRAALDAFATDDEKRMLSMREELAARTERERALSHAIESERGKLVAALSGIARAKSQLESTGRQRAELTSAMERGAAEREEQRQRAAELAQARAAFAQKLEASREEKLALAERLHDAERALSNERRALAEAEARLAAKRDELSERRSRLNSLREIERNYEGFGRGVKAVMARAADGAAKHGILGLVCDLVRAPEHLERAVEAALGERLEAVVVDGTESALALARWLKESREGRSSFLPLAAGSAAPSAAGPAERLPSEAIGLAVDLVDYDEEHAPLVRQLLGNALIVRDLSAAAACSKLGGPWTIVTLDGELIEPTGCVTGGTLEGSGIGALHKKREISVLGEQVEVLERETAEAQAQQRALFESVGAQSEALKKLSQEAHAKAISVVEHEKDHFKATDDLARLEERIARLDRELEQQGLRRGQLDVEEQSASEQSSAAEREREALAAKIEQLAREAAVLRTELADLTTVRTELQVKVAAELERREAVERSAAKAVGAQQELSDRHHRVERAASESASRRVQVEERIAEASPRLGELAGARDTLRGKHAASRAAFDERSAKLRSDEVQARADRKRAEVMQAALSDLSLKQREYSLELTHLTQTIWERHGLALAEELSNFHAMPPPTKEDEERLADLRRQVERMGEINLTAIEEHAQLAERHEFLTQQKRDLEQSLSKLQKAIVRINRTSKERFQQTFLAVNEKFQQVFPRLFNGGRASLVMVEADEGGEPGIEIMAQPPGKKLQSVNLLSGGEKALTATALIFSIFLIKPTPFCLLDEVDAPLDDANVGRYNDLVKEMSQLSQFILITHNKRTMQIADTMYGVTMEEPGISKLVSVKLSEAAREDQAASA